MTDNKNNITILKKLRPIRLAFLVGKEDKKTLREVFRINTCLWGGIYNPIIPIFKKTPKNWENHRTRSSASSILKGYLDSFDPDYIVVKDKKTINDSLFDKERILSFEDVLHSSDDCPVSFGLDITELYEYLYEKDFKFERRHPIKVFNPIPSKNIALLSACCFGEFPSYKEMNYVKENYLYCFNPKSVNIDGVAIFNSFINEGTSPLQISRANLRSVPRRSRAEPVIFFMDANSWLDIVDYWNLRAIGRDVLPLPKQYAEKNIDVCNKVIKDNYFPYRHDKKMMHCTTFILLT